MRYGFMLAVLMACGCGQPFSQGEREKIDLPSDCQKLDSAEVFFCGAEGNGVCYKVVCVNNGMPVTYLKFKGGDGTWAKYEFYFAANPKMAAGDAGARN